MPITLPQLTRREFLKRAALAGAAMGLAPAAHAGLFSKSRDKHTFAFFSDTHIAADPAQKHVSGVNMADNLAACVRQLAEWPVKPAATFITGDLALKDGQTGDYSTFGRLLDPLRPLAPLHLTLGNHDQRENFWMAFPKDAARQEGVPQKQCAVFRSSRANWFMLDSLDITNKTPGDLGPAQFDWLAGELAKDRERPALLVVHHNLNAVNGINGLKDSPVLEELFARQPQIKAFIFGHTHNWDVSQHRTGVHLINLPPTSYVFKEGRPNGWVRCTLQRDGAELELRSLDSKHSEHAQVKSLKWRV